MDTPGDSSSTPFTPTPPEGRQPRQDSPRDSLDVELDDSLRRLFQAPPADSLPAPSPAHGPPIQMWPWPRFAVAGGAIAATLALSLYLQQLYSTPQGDPGYSLRIPMMVRETLAESYARIADNAFEPAWVCKDDREFAMATEGVVGLPLRFLASDQLTADGLDYSQLAEKSGLVLIGKVAGTRVVVFINRKDDQVDLGALPETLRLHTTALGDLILRELSVLPEPVLSRGLGMAQRSLP